MMLAKETFGPVLRAARERQGISLEELAAVTKVNVDLWRDMEENDFSRWPGRLYARTYVRQYATYLGLDAESISSEFCRLFPERADRRVEGLMRTFAALVDHELAWEDERAARPRLQNRRATDSAAELGFFSRHFDRLLAVVLDLGIPVGVSAGLLMIPQLRFWPTAAVAMGVYHSVGVIFLGRTIGTVLGERGAKLLSTLPGTRHLISSRV